MRARRGNLATYLQHHLQAVIVASAGSKVEGYLVVRIDAINISTRLDQHLHVARVHSSQVSNNDTSALSWAGRGTYLTALDVAVSGGQVQGRGRVLVLHVDVRSRLNQSLAHTVMATHLQCVVVCEQWLDEATHTHINDYHCLAARRTAAKWSGADSMSLGTLGWAPCFTSSSTVAFWP